ncbi:hypothetical protein [Shewanella livingstonensis]|uniref:hypothetical protein n=1 Tax=Shewanella livingstonensis TaxID=150120 RepID=UPI001FC9FBFC|nr:hypothetical protein [Shewanella livingstonensis]
MKSSLGVKNSNGSASIEYVNEQSTSSVTSDNRKVIVFNILNAAATQLEELHGISDAGAGKNLMHLTPTRDSEFISTGAHQTPLTTLPNPTQLTLQGLLANGGISPAVLTRSLLAYFNSLGYVIKFRSYNFGVLKPTGKPSDWINCCVHYGGENAADSDQTRMHLQRELQQQAISGHISVVAECGVGGTTFSTLWLRLLTGLTISPAGSTKDSNKLAKKSAILRDLELEYRLLQSDFNPETLLSNPRFHDEIQAAIYTLMSHWPANLRLPRFAGGMMFVAPLIAALQRNDAAMTNKMPMQGNIDTTRWVCGDGVDIAPVLRLLPSSWTFRVNRTHFAKSRFSCLQVFEQGIVVEGCGFGGLLVLAEELGITQENIISVLENACEQHIKQSTAAQDSNAA